MIPPSQGGICVSVNAFNSFSHTYHFVSNISRLCIGKSLAPFEMEKKGFVIIL
jgi:hypothetical protein